MFPSNLRRRFHTSFDGETTTATASAGRDRPTVGKSSTGIVVDGSSFFLRRLQSNASSDAGTGNVKSAERPFALLIMAGVLICVIVLPICIQRRCKRRREREQIERLHRLHQLALSDFNLNSGSIGATGRTLRLNNGGTSADDVVRISWLDLDDLQGTPTDSPARMHPSFGFMPEGLSYNFSLRSMTLEDRKEYIENLLVSKSIITIHTEEVASDKGIDKDDGVSPSSIVDHASNDEPTENNEADVQKSIKVLLGDEKDMSKTSDAVIPDHCPICLVEYQEKDLLVWSQSEKCVHMFHKQCIVEWLLRNRGCPLCRHDYLSLNDDEEEADSENGLRRSDDLPMWTVTPLAESQPRSRMGFGASYRSAPPHRSIFHLQHHDHSLDVPNASSSSSRYRRRQIRGQHLGQRQLADRSNEAAYTRGMELIELLRSLQLLSETQSDGSVRLEGIELVYPSRQSRQTLSQTRSTPSFPEVRGSPFVTALPEARDSPFITHNINEEEDEETADESGNRNYSSSMLTPISLDRGESVEDDSPEIDGQIVLDGDGPPDPPGTTFNNDET